MISIPGSRGLLLLEALLAVLILPFRPPITLSAGRKTTEKYSVPGTYVHPRASLIVRLLLLLDLAISFSGLN